MHKKYNYFIVAIVLAFGPLVASSADAEDYYCKGKAKDSSYDNIFVPSGAKCVLKGTMVEGSIKVEKGGALMTQGATIKGDISADMAKYIQINDSYVEGNVQIKKTGYYEHDQKKGKKKGKKNGKNKGKHSLICNSIIRGDVQLEENFVPFAVGCEDDAGNDIGGNLEVQKHYLDPKKLKKFKYAISIQHNEISGDLQIFDNESKNMDYDPLDIWIYGNRVYQNLQCNGNYPDPLGEMNFVGGKAQDQCEDLAFSCR